MTENPQDEFPQRSARDIDAAAVLAELERDGQAHVLVRKTEDPEARAAQLICALLLLQLVEEAWSGTRVSALWGDEAGTPEFDLVFKVYAGGGKQ